MRPAFGRETEAQPPEHREPARHPRSLRSINQGTCEPILHANVVCHASNLIAPVGHRLSDRKNNYIFFSGQRAHSAPVYNARVPTTQKFHHSVYVVLLDPKALRHRSIQRLNPKRDPAKPCIYVGMTGLPVEHRLENHKHGYKSSWVVKKYWVCLLPDLYEHFNPMPFEAAVQMEMELAQDLRAEGYTVTGGK